MPTAKHKSGNTKPKATSSLKQRVQLRSIMKPLGIALVVLLVIAQLGFDVLVYRSAVQNRDNNNTIIHLVSSAVENSMLPVPVQAESGKQYIPELRLVFPATSDYSLTPLQYNYQAAVDSMPAALQIRSLSSVRRAETALWYANQPSSMWRTSNTEALFEAVPSLQACARGVDVFFGQHDAKVYSEAAVYQGEVKLQDGRTMYIYVEKPNACKQSSFDSLVAYVQQAQSY